MRANNKFFAANIGKNLDYNGARKREYNVTLEDIYVDNFLKKQKVKIVASRISNCEELAPATVMNCIS